MKLKLLIASFLFLETVNAENINLLENLSFELDIETQIFGGLYSIKNKNKYISFMLDILSDFKILKNGVHNCGLVTNFILDRTIEKSNRKPEFYKSYIYYIFDYFGEIRIGNERDAIYFSQAIDGINDNLEFNSKHSKYIFPRLKNNQDFYSNLYPVGDNDIATKILWISPKIFGWKASFSYTPDSDKCHFFDKNEKFLSKNVFSGTLSYDRGDDDGFRYSMLVGGYLGKSKINNKNINSYLLGLGIGYKKFDANLNYINNKKSLCSLDGKDDAGKIIKYSLSYNFGKLKIFGGGAISRKYGYTHEKMKLNMKKIGCEYFVNNLLTILCEYRTIKTYTTTLKKLGDKHHVFIAEFKFKKLWNLL